MNRNTFWTNRLPCSLAILSIFFVGLLVSIATASDIDGWSKYKFGIKHGELAKLTELSPLRNYQNDKKICNQKNTVNIKGIEFHPGFEFSHDQLEKINLVAIGNIGDVKDLVEKEAAINEILSSLTGKYGEPSRKWITRVGSTTFCYQWSGKKGTIVYKSSIVSNKMYLVEIYYSVIDDSI